MSAASLVIGAYAALPATVAERINTLSSITRHLKD